MNIMKSARNTLIASLVGTLVGCVLERLGVAERVWPAHPIMFVLLVTMWATVASQAGARTLKE
jgi:hypothetical protein